MKKYVFFLVIIILGFGLLKLLEFNIKNSAKFESEKKVIYDKYDSLFLHLDEKEREIKENFNKIQTLEISEEYCMASEYIINLRNPETIIKFKEIKANQCHFYNIWGESKIYPLNIYEKYVKTRFAFQYIDEEIKPKKNSAINAMEKEISELETKYKKSIFSLNFY